MSLRYRKLVAGHEVEHDWSSMRRPIVMMTRPGTDNEAALFTSVEARVLGQALIEAAAGARQALGQALSVAATGKQPVTLVAGHEIDQGGTSMHPHAWFVVMKRPGTDNDDAFFTPDEAQQLGQALIEAAEVSDQ